VPRSDAYGTLTYAGGTFLSAELLTLNVNQTLGAGTYYLVASTTTGPDTATNSNGPLLGWNTATTIDSTSYGTVDNTYGACNLVGLHCAPNTTLPAASDFVNNPPGDELQFQVCRGDCPAFNSIPSGPLPPPPPPAPEIDPAATASGLTLLLGVLAVLRGRKRAGPSRRINASAP
jgi:hypothetical protein